MRLKLIHLFFDIRIRFAITLQLWIKGYGKRSNDVTALNLQMT